MPHLLGHGSEFWSEQPDSNRRSRRSRRREDSRLLHAPKHARQPHAFPKDVLRVNIWSARQVSILLAPVIDWLF